MSLAERIEDMCEPEPNTGCYLFTGNINKDGYPRITHKRRTLRAHRVMLADKLERPLERHEQACHKCDTRSCCNREHLFAGTNLDNVRDKVAKGRQARVHGPKKIDARKAAGIRRSRRTVAWLAKKHDVSEREIQRIRAQTRHRPKSRKTWLTYEERKAEIAATASSASEYEARIAQISDEMGI